MVETGVQPCRRRVTCGARGREASASVIGIVGALPVFQVTAIAVRGCLGKIAGGMTLPTRDTGVRSGEREWRLGVIEGRVQPGRRRVAGRTGCRKSRGGVIRIVRVLEIRLVTRVAIGRRLGEVARGMALRALHRCVGAR